MLLGFTFQNYSKNVFKKLFLISLAAPIDLRFYLEVLFFQNSHDNCYGWNQKNDRSLPEGQSDSSLRSGAMYGELR